MSAGQEELMPEEEAARYLGVAVWRLREIAAGGELRTVLVEGPGGQEVMYLSGEVRDFKRRLGGAGGAAGGEEWPDFIGE